MNLLQGFYEYCIQENNQYYHYFGFWDRNSCSSLRAFTEVRVIIWKPIRFTVYYNALL